MGEPVFKYLPVKKGPLKFRIASWLIERSRDCYFCKGSGHIRGTKKIDSITTLDTSTPCPVCEGYGKHPLSWLTRYFIGLVPD